MDQTDGIAAPDPLRIPSVRKLGWIAAIALATAIPGFRTAQLIGEREDRADAVRQDVARAWGPEQRVAGPALALQIKDANGGARYLVLAPRSLDVRASLVPSTRRRGLFPVSVYEATLAMTGSFELPEGFREGGPDKFKVGGAVVAVSLAGMQGVLDGDRFDVSGAKVPWQACADVFPDDAGCGRDGGLLLAEVDLEKAEGDTLPFSATIHLRGTGALKVATAGKHAEIHIGGDWPTPSFFGADLPSASTTTAKGFEATWTRDRIGRPRYLKAMSLDGFASTGTDAGVGVDLIEATPVYRTISRVSKYAVLVVALAFATYFLFEALTGVRVALFQYAMLGASLSLFTLLLLSVSEIAGFATGYVLSCVLVTTQASIYTRSVTRRTRPAAVFAAMLATVFGFFYVLIGLESYSLVVGAAALFVVLSIVMGVTQTVAVTTEAGTTATAGTTIGAER